MIISGTIRNAVKLDEEIYTNYVVTEKYYDIGTTIISVPNEVKNTELPFIFNLYVQKGIRHLNDEQTRRWIKDRITPPSRQNIGMILKEVGIKQYDEFEILIYNKGRSCMDEFYLEECSPDLLNSYINQENNYELENDNI